MSGHYTTSYPPDALLLAGWFRLLRESPTAWRNMNPAPLRSNQEMRQEGK